MKYSSIVTVFSLVYPTAVSGGLLDRKLKEDDGPEVNPDECARTVPRIILDSLDLGEDWGYLIGQTDGDWSSVCCTTSALRAELGFLWTDFELETGNVCTPFIGAELFPNWFGEPEPDVATPARRLKSYEEIQESITNTKFKKLAPNNKEMKKKFDEIDVAVRAHFKPDTDFKKLVNDFLGSIAKKKEVAVGDQATQEGTHRKLIAGPFEAFLLLLTEECPDLVEVLGVMEFLDFGPEFFLITEFLFFLCNYIKDALALFALFLYSPWLMPACHCKYRKMGCGIESCYDSCTVECETVYTPKTDLVSDVGIATNDYAGAYLYDFLEDAKLPAEVPEIASEFLGTLRACQACPGEQTFFLGRLGGIGNIIDDFIDAIPSGEFEIDESASVDTASGLFPIRRGGKPYEECLGFCYMYGVVESEGFFCGPTED